MNSEAEEKGHPEDALTCGGRDEITSQLWLLRRSVSSRAAMRMERTQTVGTTISEGTCMRLSKGSGTESPPEVGFVLKQKLKEMGHCVSNFSHLL